MCARRCRSQHSKPEMTHFQAGVHSLQQKDWVPWESCLWSRWQSHCLPSDCSTLHLSHPDSIGRNVEHIKYSHRQSTTMANVCTCTTWLIFHLCGRPVCGGIYPSLQTTPGMKLCDTEANLLQVGVWVHLKCSHHIRDDIIWNKSKLVIGVGVEGTFRVLSSLPDTILLPENCRQVITWSSCPFNTCNSNVNESTLKFQSSSP